MKAILDRVTIDVKNLDEAKKFFSKLLNTTFEDEPEGMTYEITPSPTTPFKFRYAISPIGIELFEMDPPVEVEGVRNVTWRVENMDEAKEELEGLGISHVFDNRCGGIKEAVYSGVYGVRWVLNEYEGESFIKALAKKKP
jgi:predicted enzyme related to lactoylglutathione lyase